MEFSETKFRGTSDKNTILNIYHRLFDEYGPQYWWPGDSKLEIIVGAILTQGTLWENAEKAVSNLRHESKLDIASLHDMTDGEMARLLHPSVYFNVKTRKVKAFVWHILDKYHGDLDLFLSSDAGNLRRELLGIYGIGEETADDIVLYAAGKPSFVIDEYTRRILIRIGIYPDKETYSGYQDLFIERLPSDANLFGEFHALLDEHASNKCLKVKPICDTCCLMEICSTGLSSLRG